MSGRPADDRFRQEEHAWLVGYITSLIFGGLRRDEEDRLTVRVLKDPDDSLTTRLGITTASGQYILSIEPATLELGDSQ